MLKLLRGWLRAGVFEGGIRSAIEAGTPQRSPISPLLANVALHVLDGAWATEGRRLGVLVRYADDLVVLCATPEQAHAARELAAAVLDTLGLRLHPDKTGIAHLARGAEGLTFLGFHHRMRESGKRPGRWYLQKWPAPRAMASIKAKIRERTPRTIAHLPLERTVENLNPVLQGWGSTSATETPRASSPRSTPTSTSGWRSWPAPSTASAAGTGPPASPTGGSPASVSIASPEQSVPPLRMPAGERCR
jgi:hypothetical protein